MPRIPLTQYTPKTPLARLRREFLFHKDGRRFYQADLARDLEVTQSIIQQLELGTEALPKKRALQLQEIYGISADWLLKGDPKARPVTPEGRPYSKAIAFNQRNSVRLSKEPTADFAWHLSLSLEALLSELRAAIIRVDKKSHKTSWRQARFFSEIRDAVLKPLRDADPSTPRSIRACMLKLSACALVATNPDNIGLT